MIPAKIDLNPFGYYQLISNAFDKQADVQTIVGGLMHSRESVLVSHLCYALLELLEFEETPRISEKFEESIDILNFCINMVYYSIRLDLLSKKDFEEKLKHTKCEPVMINEVAQVIDTHDLKAKLLRLRKVIPNCTYWRKVDDQQDSLLDALSDVIYECYNVCAKSRAYMLQDAKPVPDKFYSAMYSTQTLCLGIDDACQKKHEIILKRYAEKMVQDEQNT